MKIGSLVEYISTEIITNNYIINLKYPKKNTIYTIRKFDIDSSGDISIIVYLEELVCGINAYTGEEMAFGIKAYREIQIPPQIEEEITESLTKELILV